MTKYNDFGPQSDFKPQTPMASNVIFPFGYQPFIHLKSNVSTAYTLVCQTFQTTKSFLQILAREIQIIS